MTVKELKAYGEKKGIKILGITKREEILKAIQKEEMAISDDLRVLLADKQDTKTTDTDLKKQSDLDNRSPMIRIDSES